jgi:dihydroxy-acid dehydratase
MLNGWWKGERAGSGTVVWWARQEHAAGRMDYKEFLDLVSSSAPSIGHCNTMGTASTMNALAEALGLSLPAVLPFPRPTASARRSPTTPAAAQSRSCART